MDPNVFALIFPRDLGYNASGAFASKENSHLYVPRVDHTVVRSSRESTPDISAETECEDSGNNVERLQLCFNDDPPLKNPAEGWQFGYSSHTSDVVVCRPGTAAVSRRHFAITITPDSRIQFRQRTIQTTRVRFCHASGHRHEIQPQEGETFLVCLAPWETHYWNSIEVSLSFGSREVCFEIVFPNHTEDGPRAYHDNLRQWIQDTASTLPALGGLGLESGASTIAPSRQSPTPPPFSSLCYQRRIGSGAFRVVELLVDLTTGTVAVRKRFFRLSTEAKGQDAVKDWDRAMVKVWNEVRLMRQNPHPNIVRMLAFQESPVPAILMPYYRHGNIESMSLLPWQYRSAFRQLLVVLDYLHSRNVAHRDLKPENILVERVDPLHIVISDFGLSREVVPDTLMTTFCGTRLYGAPDIFPSHRRRQSMQGYWVSVDIWSAGVIMLEWTYGRPTTRGMMRTPADVWIKFWSQTLVEEVRKRERENPRDPVMDILKHMLVLDPENRFQARDCLQQGCANGLFRRARSGDVIDAGDDDAPDDSGAKTPTETRQVQLPDDDEKGACPTVTQESWSSAAEKQEQCDGEKDDNHGDSGASPWQRLLDFDLLPPCPEAQADEAAYASQDTSQDTSQEFVSAVEEMPPEQPLRNLAATAPEPPPATQSTAGTKRPRHSGKTSSSAASSSLSSGQGPAPPKKRRPVNVGFDSAVWSDVLGSKPRLGVLSSQLPSSGLPSSMSLIDFAQEMGPASEAPTITSSMSLLDGASNFSARAA